jgi:anti-sigma-K factor RskA
MDLLESTPQLPAEGDEHELAPVAPIREFERPAAARAKARWFARPALLVTSLAAAAALILGGVVVSSNLRDMSAQNEAFGKYTQITSAEDAQNVVADVTGGGTATVHWSEELGSAAVTVDGVTALPGSKTYEMWFIGTDGTPRAAGTFNTNDSGDQWSVLTGDLQPGDTIGLTVEPAGGSTAPTTTPVVAVTTA